MQVTLDAKWKQLENAAIELKRSLKQEVAIVLNQAAKATASQINKSIRTDAGLRVSAKAIARGISHSRNATNKSLKAEVTLRPTSRISLKEFNATQKADGTSYTITKRQGRRSAQGAFMGPRPGVIAAKLRGHVYKRVNPQDSRSPIRKLKGPSPWGVYVKSGLSAKTLAATDQDVERKLDRRIRDLLRKLEGKY